MTGLSESSGPMPLSIVTIESLADLGYVVDRGAADPYTLPAGAFSIAEPPVSTSAPTDILDVDPFVLDSVGNISLSAFSNF